MKEKNKMRSGENTNPTDTKELEKSKPHFVSDVIQYLSNSVVSKTILRKITGNITALSFDTGEELAEKTTPYDTFIQIIEGAAQIHIVEKKHHLKLGYGIVIPAHEPHSFFASEKFKMISTVIKSGYED